MNLNKTQLIGNLAADPAARKLPSGRPVAQFRLVTNTVTENARAEIVLNQAEYHHIVTYGKLADVVGKYLKKGDRAYVEGFLTTRTWRNKSGAERSRTEVVAQNLIMLGGAKKPEPEPTNDEVVVEEIDTEKNGEG